MTSANQAVSDLHRTFCECTGRDLNLTFTAERWWLEASTEGLTPEDLANVIQARQQAIRKGIRYQRCLALVNIVGSSEAILNTLDEAAEIRARKRVKMVDPARASVLRATERPVTTEQKEPQRLGDVELIKKLKDACG